MNRRNFLRTTGALSLPALLSQGVAADPAGFFTNFINPDSDRVLVLIRLSGGNDGLNTVIGLDQYANLQAVRPNVVVPQSQTLGLDTNTALHPAMSGMQTLFNQQQLNVVQAVGYPNQNRSHFRSTDIWSTGSAANETITSGWLGRYLELDHAGFPTGYPNDTFPYPLAMTMGNVVSATCQGTEANLSVVVNNPFNYLYIAPGGNTSLPNNYYGSEVNYVRDLIGQSNEYGAVVQDAANAGNTISTNYTNGKLSDQLQNIATLISGGLGTKIYVATLGSFDTHSNQVNGNNSTGTHADLLAELSDSIRAFQEDLEALGVADRVLGMTFSEFGRRIKSNQSNGTDHGDAGPLFLFGNCASGTILGNSPEIDQQVAQTTGVPLQYDFRDVYGSVLMDWFDVPRSTVATLFSNGFTYLPVANGCNNVLAVDDLRMVIREQEATIDVEWNTSHEIDNQGFFVRRGRDGRTFKNLQWVPAGPQGTGNTYSFKDTTAELGVTYYYQVVAKDYAGVETSSGVQLGRLRGTGTGSWSVGLPRPNPVSPESYVKVYAPKDDLATYELIDQQGRRLRTGNVTLIGRQDNRIPLRAGNLPTGSYVWRLHTSDGRRFARKLTRVR